MDKKKVKSGENILGGPVKVAAIKQKSDVLDFKVYRENPNDPFKPNSESAIKFLASQPPKQKLRTEDEQLIQCVAADLDRSLSVEEILVSPYLNPNMTFECYLAVEKLPTWLKSMIRARFTVIHEYFKGDTPKFLRSLAAKIEQRDLLRDQTYGGFAFGREPDVNRFALDEDDLEDRPITAFEAGGGMTAVRVAEALGKWKAKNDSLTAWDRSHVHYAADKLRQGLSMKAGAHDLLLVEEDAHIHRGVSEGESTDSDEEFTDDKPKWESMFQPGVLEQEAEGAVDRKLWKHAEKDEGVKPVQPGEARPAPQGRLSNLKKRLRVPTIALPKIKWLENKRRREGELGVRGHFRRYSKLFYTGCGDQVPAPQRLEHHHRVDESFHAFTVTFVSWFWFQAFIMFMIFVNAIVLAAETFSIGEDEYVIFDIFDELFLAVYLAEAALKIYAHPFRYWTSGFNIFDFLILLVSITKSVIDWLNFADIAFLRVLLIVRALRVLRSISLSIQLQVLVTALVETVKKHVLSVVILLTLLIYIAAIVAFYLFGDKLVDVWGFVPLGMLRMVAYVTLDGWTDLQKEFEDKGLLVEGRIFNLICIVLGNFMFSNIFIAIIIFNISEATDLFRERIRSERENVVRRKKETVFRRQKLDMRQLLARQKKSFTADFFYMASQFQRLLRHDDLVAMKETCTSPLWIDSAYQTLLRTTHTSNVLLNLHREMADNILHIHRLHDENKLEEKTISRGRYNRYMRVKAKLALIKKEILRFRQPPTTGKLRIRFEQQ